MRISKTISLMVASVFVLFAAGMLTAPNYARIDPKSVVGLWLLDESQPPPG